MKLFRIVFLAVLGCLMCGSCASHRSYWGVEGEVPGSGTHYYMGQAPDAPRNPYKHGTKAWKKWEKKQRKAAEKRRKKAEKHYRKHQQHRHDRQRGHRHHDRN